MSGVSGTTSRFFLAASGSPDRVPIGSSSMCLFQLGPLTRLEPHLLRGALPPPLPSPPCDFRGTNHLGSRAGPPAVECGNACLKNPDCVTLLATDAVWLFVLRDWRSVAF